MAHWEKEKDIVWICPNDTKGKVLTIAGLKVGLPAIPPKEEILFHDLPKEDQKWHREELPEELKEFDTDEEYQEAPKEFRARWDAYILKQWERRINGVWFYNNGEPTYLTGTHWYLLQWAKQDFGWGDYLEPQAELEYHWAACVADPRSYGQNLVKNRRFGWSTLAGNDMLETLTRTKNANGGIFSKTSKDAQDVVFQQKLVYPFNNLPFFFKPLTDGTSNPKTILSLRAPASKITKNFKKRIKSTGLHSMMRWFATANNSGDGYKFLRIIEDESGKIEKPNTIKKMWQVRKRCLEIRNTLYGKCRMGSTVNPMDKGGEEYKKLFFDGLLEGEEGSAGRDANGRTKSGLYSIFIPAYRCIIYDKYGRSVVEDPEEPIETIDGLMTEIGGKTHLNNVRDSLKDDAVAYNEEIRQMPFNIREAFMDTIESSVFNIQKIEEQRNYNDLMRRKDNPVLKGRFEWVNERFGDVKWVSDNKSPRFKIVWLQDPELRNRREKVGGAWKPMNGWMGVGGLDPYGMDTTEYGGSKGAIYFYNKDNPRAPQNTFVVQYLHRPPTLVDFYEDALKAAIFYGYPILIENSKYEIARYFIEWGFGHYLLSRPRMSVNPLSKPSDAELRKKGIPATTEIIRQLDGFTEEYINRYVGYDEEGNIGRVFFDELLEDWKKYDPHKRTKFDATVASSHALYASKMDIRGAYTPEEGGRSAPLVRQFKL